MDVLLTCSASRSRASPISGAILVGSGANKSSVLDADCAEFDLHPEDVVAVR